MRILAFLLLFFCSLAFGEADPSEELLLLSDLQARGYSVSEPLSVQFLEAESLAELENDAPRVPRVPFGFANAAWQRLKSKVEPGDVIVRAKSPPKAWRDLAGWRGLLLVREGIVIDSLTEEVS